MGKMWNGIMIQAIFLAGLTSELAILKNRMAKKLFMIGIGGKRDIENRRNSLWN